MAGRPRMALTGVVLDTPDPRALAAFYQRLLGWSIGADEPTWVTLRPPGGHTGISFQLEPLHVRPTWPARPDQQLMMSHLDIAAADLDAAVAHARAAGATLAAVQPQEGVRVLLDPDGHPFCLFAYDFPEPVGSPAVDQETPSRPAD
jgi:catechol 2,3-dioxygenase-like lactoylglutathione lyase family enzyme